MGISVLYKPNIILGNNSSNIEPIEEGQDFYNLLIDGIQSYTLPSDIGIKRELREHAFEYANIKRVYLNNATIIPRSCFASSRLEGIIGSKIYEIEANGLHAGYELKYVSVFTNCRRINTNGVDYCQFSSLNIDSPSVTCLNWANFANNSNLRTLSIHNMVFGSSTFAACSKLETVDLGYTQAVGEAGFARDVMLRTVSAFNVRYIWTRAFAECYYLSQLYGFSGVGALGNSAFYMCSNLSSVFFPFLSSIGGSSVFKSCANLRTVEIGAAAYSQGVGTGTFTLPTTAFDDCVSLNKLVLLTAVCPLLNGSNAFTNTPITDSSYLGHYGSIYVPSNLYNTIRSATNWVFFSDRFVPLSSNYDSKFVYAYEFYSQSSLKRIPNAKSNAEYIGLSAFEKCLSLSGVSLSKCKMIGENAFRWCSSIKTVDLPQCEFINQYAFASCYSLQRLNASNLKDIGTYAFYHCSQLKELNLPKCKIIRTNAFRNCSNLSSVYLPNCEIVEFGAFSDCSNLSVIDLPNCTIYSGAETSAVTTLNIPKAKIIQLNYANMSVVNFPNCIEFSTAYWNSYGAPRTLREVCLPNACSVGGFRNAYSMTRLEIPNCIFLPAYAVQGCSSLSEIFLPKLSMLQDYCFHRCATMNRAFFGNIGSISGSHTFEFCSSLASLYWFNMSVTSLSYSNIFDNTPMVDSSYLGHYGSIYVPAYLVSEYQAHSMWSYFSDRFVGLTDQEMQDIIDHWND